jgi:hypothetical protein
VQLPPQADPSVLQEPWPGAGDPLETREQVPLLPEMLHALHVSVQGALQQTPSAQMLLRHSFSDEQGCPLFFFATHFDEPASQYVSPRQG